MEAVPLLFIDSSKRYECRGGPKSFVQGHLVEPLCQVSHSENLGFKLSNVLQDVFHVGYLPPLVGDNLVQSSVVDGERHPRLGFLTRCTWDHAVALAL